MADQFSRMYDVERVGGDQRQRLAEMLRANALNAPQGQMVSGWYVPPSWSQNLAQMANTAVGVFGGMTLDKERKETAAKLLREISEGVPVEQTQQQTVFNNIEQTQPEGQTPAPQQSALAQIVRGQRPTEPAEMTPATMRQPEQPKFRPLTEDERLGKVMELARVDPYAAQIWSAQDTAKQARALKLEDLAERRAYEEKKDERERQWRREEKVFAASLAAGNRAEKPLTEFQGKSMNFGTRSAEADKILRNTEYNPVSVEAVRKTGVVGNLFAAPETQKVVQAQRDFVNAVLRQESGAAISASEFENAQKQYFPQPGDSADVIAQKARNRETVIKGFARQAGPSGGRDVVETFNAPYAVQQTPQQTPAKQGRLGGLTPPNTQVKFLGFEK